MQQYNEAPLDFLVAEYAIGYPFTYQSDDKMLLSPCMAPPVHGANNPLVEWIANIWKPTDRIQTYTLLHRICTHIHESLSYRVREAPGVQTAEQTLTDGTGSCRDFAVLFMVAAQYLGFASRFVSGYLYAPPSTTNLGATHAWAEVYLPGAGWKGFDPTIGKIAGADHFAVAVARLPESVPPIAGSFVGAPGSRLDVGVWVTRC